MTRTLIVYIAVGAGAYLLTLAVLNTIMPPMERYEASLAAYKLCLTNYAGPAPDALRVCQARVLRP